MVSRPSHVTIGRRVAAARREAGLTQARLARAVGVDRTALAKMESGRRAVSALELARIAGKLDRSLEWFLFGPRDVGGRVLLRAVRAKRRQILRIAAKHGAHSVRLFGSVARGEATEGSDVDFLVDFEPGRSLFDQGALLVELREFLGREVDVATEAGLRERIRDRVLKEAVSL